MTVQTSTIPGAIDYLFTNIKALSVCQPPVQVTDGFPGPNEQDDIVAIGGRVDPVADARSDWYALGNIPSREERYTIEITVSCYRGGDAAPDAGDTTANAQKAARDAAFTIVNAIDVMVRTDVTFGGLFGTGFAGILDQMRVEQTNDTNDPGMGRVCEVTFHVGVMSVRRGF